MNHPSRSCLRSTSHGLALLDYDDGMVEYGLPLRRDIAHAIRIHKPEVVITLTHRERFAGGGTNQAAVTVEVYDI